jgi:uncharacterized iron-regulated protein
MIEKIVAALLIATGTLLLPGCVGIGSSRPDILTLSVGDPERKGRQVAVQVDAVVNTLSGSTLSPQALSKHLADARLILIAEQHTNLEDHRIQLRVLELLQETERPLMIGLEMFEVEDQPILNAWIAGTVTEPDFIVQSDWYGSWGYHWGYYREILLFARAHAIPLVALSAPWEVVSETGAAPDLSSQDHRSLFRAFFETDDPVHGGLQEDQFEELFAAQCRRDAVMAFNAAEALEAHPDATLVVLAGIGHVVYELGIARQIQEWYKGPVTTIVPVSVGDANTRVRASIGDFAWGVPEMTDPAFPELGAVWVSVEGGLHVIHVEPDSPAERGGLETGDVLTRFKDVAITAKPDLNRTLATVEWGDEVALIIQRAGAPRDLTLTFQR